MNNNQVRGAAVVAAAAIALSALAACSIADQKQSSASNDASQGTVTVITHDSFSLSDDAIAEFEKVSGYKLQTTAPGDAGTMTKQLLLTADSSDIDAVYGIDNLSAGELSAAGILGRAVSDQVWGDDGDAPVLTEDVYATKDGGTLIPIDRGDVCMNIDNAWFDDTGTAKPETFDDLLKPELKGKTVVTNPASSSPGLAMLAGTQALYGDSWLDYWKSLLDNNAKVDAGWSDAYEVDFSAGGGEGAYPIVLSYASSPAFSGGATSSVDATCVPQIEYAGVLKNSSNPEGAQAFVDFMLSKKVQAEIPNSMYMYPVREGVEVPSEWAQYAKLPAASISVDADVINQNRDSWLKEWQAMFESHEK
ncbi:MAG: thiamine ABC transporter substrate-binding protein [Arcanobacterium sp.]|nr:thiamine ABC transporter substrate-binding protein [Arcanobacterium sp.]